MRHGGGNGEEWPRGGGFPFSVHSLSQAATITIRYAAFLKHGIGHVLKCLGWPNPATFLPFETPIVTLCLLAPRNTRCGSAYFGEQVDSKHGTWYSERVTLQFMCVGSWAGVTYLRYTVLMSPNKDKTAVHCCNPAVSVLVMFAVSKRLARGISFAVYCPCNYNHTSVPQFISHFQWYKSSSFLVLYQNNLLSEQSL